MWSGLHLYRNKYFDNIHPNINCPYSRINKIYSLQCDLNNVRVQVQATVVGFLASIAAVIFSWIPEGHFRLGHAVLLCASSVATAFIASLLLGRCH